MFTMMDRDEVLRFVTTDELATYLGRVAASEYTEKVLNWAKSTDQTLWIANGKDMDIWYKK